MSERFELHPSIKDYLDDYIDSEGRLPDEDREDFLLQVARRIQYDASFEKGLLRKNIDAIGREYPNVKLWEEDQDEGRPDPETATKKQFDEQIVQLRKNFSKERVEWLEKVGKRLYGPQVGESQRQESRKDPAKTQNYQYQSNTQNRRAPLPPKKKISWRMLIATGVAVVAIIVLSVMMLFGADSADTPKEGPQQSETQQQK